MPCPVPLLQAGAEPLGDGEGQERSGATATRKKTVRAVSDRSKCVEQDHRWPEAGRSAHLDRGLEPPGRDLLRPGQRGIVVVRRGKPWLIQTLSDTYGLLI
jgi:hypothetical protein